MRTLYAVLSVLLFSILSPLYVNAHPRMIVTTDIGGSDPDDVQSLVHLLVSLDRVELEGIISQHAWVPYGTGATDIINKLISGYEAVLPNLRKHSAEFPSADYLRSTVKVGQPEAAMAGVGDGKDSDGAEWIIKTVDKDDERPVYYRNLVNAGLHILSPKVLRPDRMRA